MLAISIGNFDGVHRGHRALIAAARGRVGPDGRVVAVAFEPHPAVRLRPERAPARLTDAATRRSLLLEAGADDVVELDPSAELLGLDGGAFIEQLRRAHEFDTVVEGADFRFGRGRSCGVDELRAIGGSAGFSTVVVPEVTCELDDGTLVPARSSLCRWLLERGRVRDAACILARSHSVRGCVRRGERRGRTIGVPTANVDTGQVLLPADGVYAALATLPDGRRRLAAVSIGTKPSFETTSERTCEAHLLDHEAPIDDYGWQLELAFVHWVRAQRRFEGIGPLREQIERDLLRVRDLGRASMARIDSGITEISR